MDLPKPTFKQQTTAQGLFPMPCSCLLFSPGFYRKLFRPLSRKVQVGKDQEKAQSERDSHSKNRGGKKTN